MLAGPLGAHLCSVSQHQSAQLPTACPCASCLPVCPPTRPPITAPPSAPHSCAHAGFLNESCEFPGQMWSYLSDGSAIVAGSMMGSTSLTVYIESAAGAHAFLVFRHQEEINCLGASCRVACTTHLAHCTACWHTEPPVHRPDGKQSATGHLRSLRCPARLAGIEDGGRTGLTAIVVSFFFFVALFFSPILASIPPYATGPALVLVGRWHAELQPASPLWAAPGQRSSKGP